MLRSVDAWAASRNVEQNIPLGPPGVLNVGRTQFKFFSSLGNLFRQIHLLTILCVVQYIDAVRYTVKRDTQYRKD